MLLVPAMLPVMAVTPYRLYDNLFYFSVNHCYYQFASRVYSQSRLDKIGALHVTFLMKEV